MFYRKWGTIRQKFELCLRKYGCCMGLLTVILCYAILFHTEKRKIACRGLPPLPVAYFAYMVSVFWDNVIYLRCIFCFLRYDCMQAGIWHILHHTEILFMMPDRCHGVIRAKEGNHVPFRCGFAAAGCSSHRICTLGNPARKMRWLSQALLWL